MVRPIKEYSAGKFKLAVFENEIKEGVKIRSAVLQKSYKDKNDEWVNKSIPINLNEVSRVEVLIERFKREELMKEVKRE